MLCKAKYSTTKAPSKAKILSLGVSIMLNITPDKLLPSGEGILFSKLLTLKLFLNSVYFLLLLLFNLGN